MDRETGLRRRDRDDDRDVARLRVNPGRSGIVLRALVRDSLWKLFSSNPKRRRSCIAPLDGDCKSGRRDLASRSKSI